MGYDISEVTAFGRRLCVGFGRSTEIECKLIVGVSDNNIQTGSIITHHQAYHVNFNRELPASLLGRDGGFNGGPLAAKLPGTPRSHVNNHHTGRSLRAS